MLQENVEKYIFSTLWLANSDATLLNEHNIFTWEISPDLLFQNKNPHDESIIDPTSNSEYSNKNVSISSENSEPSSSQEPEKWLVAFM